MPQPDHEIIKAVLAAVLSDTKDAQGRTETGRLDPRPGTLTAQPPKIWLTAEEAWREFCALDVHGWLQNAHTETILHGDGQALKSALDAVPADKRWPVAGERASADGQTSLHLRRTAAGWELTRFTEAGPLTPALSPAPSGREGARRADEGVPGPNEVPAVQSPAPPGDGLLLTHRLLSADLKEYLVYHVAYRPERVGNHDELRPCASRFVGFEPISAP